MDNEAGDDKEGDDSARSEEEMIDGNAKIFQDNIIETLEKHRRMILQMRHEYDHCKDEAETVESPYPMFSWLRLFDGGLVELLLH